MSILERYIRVAAPSKVNLTLDVGERRADGFHDLDSVVITLFPADKLVVTMQPSDKLCVTCTRNDPSLPTDDRNLAVRATLNYCEFADLKADIHIQLTKRLPAQAGLGGGSSDAGAVLRALRLLNNDESDMSAMAAAIKTGSDVPLFLGETGFVRMEGRGERLTVLQNRPMLHGVIVRPNVGVPTVDAYRMLDDIPDRVIGTATVRLWEVLANEPSMQAERLAGLLSNDFEAAIFPAFPAVEDAYRAVEDAGALRALLCGSGSAIFGLASDGAHARKLTRTLQNRFPFVRRAKGIF